MRDALTRAAAKMRVKTGQHYRHTITGDVPPYAYNWTDANNNTVWSTLNLTDVGGGGTLGVTDLSGCSVASATYTILEQDNDIAPPSVNNLQVLQPG